MSGGEYGFSKKSRLLTPLDFTHFRSESQTFRCRSFLVLIKPSRLAISSARLGLSVSKKAGRAHTRNRIKRIIREYFRCSDWRALPKDFLFIVNRRFEDEMEKGLRDDLDRLTQYLSKRS